MSNIKFKPDTIGFPMVSVDTLDFYVHWYPITKIQFEYFLCARPSHKFNASWYNEILNLNPRVTPKRIKADNYWQAFLTGIQPTELNDFIYWYGERYELPTLDEWMAIYNSLNQFSFQEVSNSFDDAIQTSKERTKTLLINLNKVATTKGGDTLVDQMFMHQGIMEWVSCPDSNPEWGGMGEPHAKFSHSSANLKFGYPDQLRNPNKQRAHDYGFRLIWRK